MSSRQGQNRFPRGAHASVSFHPNRICKRSGDEGVVDMDADEVCLLSCRG